MAQIAERHDAFLGGFDAFRREPEFGSGRLAEARDTAFARLRSRGLPTTRDEEWRHTNVAPISDVPFERAAEATLDRKALAPFLFADMAGTVVVVNGRPSKALSSVDALPRGLTVRGIGDQTDAVLSEYALANAGAFVDLNTAFHEGAVVVEIATGAVIEQPLHVLFVSVLGARPSLVAPRLVIVAGEGASASVVEHYVETGRGAALVTAVTDVRVAPGAMLDHVKLQQQGETFHLATMFAETGRSGTFTSHAITLGGRIARNDVVSLLGGEGAECTLNGLYVATGDALVDTHTFIDHAVPHCPSHEVYKGILGGKSRAVFNGKILVRQDAQKTDAKQTNRALLLTDDAQINTKPQLEIFADDVKCTHGAAIGQLDEDAMFYLQARGIGSLDARNMLIHAFAGDVLRGVRHEAVRTAAAAAVDEKLSI